MQNTLPEGTSQSVIDGYNAPFPTVEHRAGVAVWPLMVPMESGDPLAGVMTQAQEYLKTWQKPTLILFATDDPILGPAAPLFEQLIPHARSISIETGGHFLQETQSPVIAQHILELMETP